MPRNHGHKPGLVAGKRVRVSLFGGYDSHEKSPQGWAADTCDWRIDDPPHPYQIKAWKVIV